LGTAGWLVPRETRAGKVHWPHSIRLR
jgi:hypothetical protein